METIESLESLGFDKIYKNPDNEDILICVRSEEDHILREHYSVPEDKFLGKTEWWASCGRWVGRHTKLPAKYFIIYYLQRAHSVPVCERLPCLFPL